MNPKKATIIIIISDHLGDGLQALLETIPNIGPIYRAENPVDLLLMATQHKPALVVLDFQHLGKERTQALARLKSTIPPPKCIILADNQQQQAQASAAGADITLIKGDLSTKLILAIETILGDTFP